MYFEINVNMGSKREQRKINEKHKGKKSRKLYDANFGIFYGPNKEVLEECFMKRKIEMKEEELLRILF